MGAALACVGDEPSGMVTLDQGADELAGGERLGELWVDAPEGQSGQNRGSCHLHMEDAQFDPSGLTADAPIGWPDPADAAVFVLELRGSVGRVDTWVSSPSPATLYKQMQQVPPRGNPQPRHSGCSLPRRRYYDLHRPVACSCGLTAASRGVWALARIHHQGT